VNGFEIQMVAKATGILARNSSATSGAMALWGGNGRKATNKPIAKPRATFSRRTAQYSGWRRSAANGRMYHISRRRR